MKITNSTIPKMLFLLLVAVPSTLAGDDKAVGTKPVRATDKLGANRRALIIGINDYAKTSACRTSALPSPMPATCTRR